MIKSEEKTPEQPKNSGLPAAPLRPYQRPELLEWGSLVELTRGPLSGLEDVPVSDAGTSVE